MQNITKRLIVWAIIVAAVLMIPLLAKWPWTGGDFVFGVVVLFGSALVYELVARKMNNKTYRFAVGTAVVAALLLVWINAAVGIIGDGDLDSPNALYFGVLSIGFISAFVARFEPLGMSRVLFAVATALMLVPLIALVIAPQLMMEPPGMVKRFVFNTFFAALFAASALLFRRAGTTVEK